MRKLFMAGLLLSMALLTGCGEGGPKTYPVAGTVTFESKPIAEGDILFVPEDSTQAPDGARIENGKYEARVKPGKHRVQIKAMREGAGEAEKGAMGELIKPKEQYLPPKFNEATELTVEVPGGKYDFSL
jgi:hypothetical protein